VTQDRDAELSDIMQNHEDALQQQEALHKQELEYRATMMKESLSRVSEVMSALWYNICATFRVCDMNLYGSANGGFQVDHGDVRLQVFYNCRRS